MSAVIERSLQVLEQLALHPHGRALSTLAAESGIPLSALHRLLTELVRCGYVRQNEHDGHYVLTIKLVSLGLMYLSSTGIVDIAQPLLDQLAAASGELVRLAVVDGEELTFVAKAQGATHGLRYDPDMGLSVTLSCSAAGHAWLSTLPTDTALSLIARQGLGDAAHFGPKAPTSIKAVMKYVSEARQRGFSMINDVFAPGMTAMAVPVLATNGKAIGVITIAGPAVRLTTERMLALGPVIQQTALQVAHASGASALFKRQA